MSPTVQMAMYASGVLLLLGSVVVVLVRLAAMEGRGTAGAMPSSWYGVIFSLPIAFKVLSMPQEAKQQREKRLQEYRASALPDAPPPVQLPPPPDAVSLSAMFGGFALTTPLVSSLLLVVVFGPAAIVCGVVALALGHLKGLIGIGLGIVSLIVWGLVFVYLFQG
jgi:hypothetical protein